VLFGEQGTSGNQRPSGNTFYWPPGYSVRITDDAEVILFTPSHEHTQILDRMVAKMAQV
jgi:hypothetical protein